MPSPPLRLPEKFLISFVPERWGEVDRFINFYSTTHNLDKRTSNCVNGIASHFRKANVLLALANRIRPGLAQDNEQVESEGFSAASNARELAPVIEAILFEIYASIDCTATVLSALYGRLQGIPSKSTRRLFTNAVAGKVDSRFPKAVLDALVQAAPSVATLRELRDTVSHSDTGFCHLDSQTGAVVYMNPAMGPGDRAHVIEDVFAEITRYALLVNQMHGVIFRYLNTQLADAERTLLCGFYLGRAYTRLVRVSEATSFAAGRCQAYIWFEKEENPRCPLAEECGAYSRASSEAVHLP